MAGFHADSKLEDLVVSILEGGATAFVETGTGQGDSSDAVARRCGKPVLTCDVDAAQIEIAKRLLPSRVEPALMSSEKFIPTVKGQAGNLPLFFLDAHWHDYWPLLDELRAIGSHYEKAVIVVHDFKVPGRDDFSYCVGGGGTVGVTRTAPQTDDVAEAAYIEPVLTAGRYQFFYPDYVPPERTPGYAVIFQNAKPVGNLGEFRPVMDVTVLISAVDAYSVAWEATCHGLHKYWPNRPWPVMWYTNKKEAPCGETVKTGRNRNWAAMTRKVLPSIKSPAVLLMMNDVWLCRPVDMPRLARMLGAMLRSGADHLQLQSPRLDGTRETEFNDDLYCLDPGVIYRTSLQPAFWQTDTLTRLIEDGDELPGDFEARAGYRDPGGLYLAAKSVGMGFVNPIERGRWVRAAHGYVLGEGLEMDFSRDPMGGF